MLFKFSKNFDVKDLLKLGNRKQKCEEWGNPWFIISFFSVLLFSVSILGKFCFIPLSRAAVVHLNFRAGSTFSVPVCNVPSSKDRTSRCNKVDAVRLYASYRLNLLLLRGRGVCCFMSRNKIFVYILYYQIWNENVDGSPSVKCRNCIS